jgi:hypothetical protein
MIESTSEPAEDRRAALVAAEKRAEKLFEEIELQGLLRSGRTERLIEQDIYAIALQRFGVEKHWHKRIVRAGALSRNAGYYRRRTLCLCPARG